MKTGSVCPWWGGGALKVPIRKLIHNPQKMLAPYIQEAMTVADLGCGMGYFTIEMARLVVYSPYRNLPLGIIEHLIL